VKRTPFFSLPTFFFFTSCWQNSDEQFVIETVKATARVADAFPDCAEQILSGMMALVQTNEGGAAVVAECLKVIRHLMQSKSGALTSSSGGGTSKSTQGQIEHMIRKLARLLSQMVLPSARASVIWLIGEFQEHVSSYAPDVLRLLAKGFKEEDVEVKLQIMNMAAKLNLAYPSDGKIEQLLKYILDMAKYDVNYDLRDRARLMVTASAKSSVLRGAVGTSRAKKGGAGSSSSSSSSSSFSSFSTPKYEGVPTSQFSIGSLSEIVGHKVQGYRPLSEWRTSQPETSLRDVPSSAPGWEETPAELGGTKASSSSSKKKKKNDFYGMAWRAGGG
jgi:AP-3 complex subunit beta